MIDSPDAQAGTVQVLDLTSLACGSRQHVYVPTANPTSRWVYKLPSASGVNEQYGADLREYRPTGRLMAAVYRTLVRLPNARHERRMASLERRGASEEERRRAAMGHLALCEARGRVLDPAYRWTRRRHFARMLMLAQELENAGFADLMLPCRVVHDRVAVLHSRGASTSYRGSLLIQKRADFFDRSGRFDAFEWDDVILTQHRLWRAGIGLSDANEILGPKNWALVGGHLRLADLSSLTHDAGRIRRLIADDVLDERQERVLTRLRREGDGAMADLATRYFSHIRAGINPARFHQLWRPAR